MKKYLLAAALLTLLIGIPGQALAAGRTNVQTTATAGSEVRMNNLKERANQEIDRRVSALNGLITKINNMKKLSAVQKASFTGKINEQISDLIALKSKIDGDTDPQTLISDVKSIVDSYRIYVLFMPQIDILDAADRISVINDQMSTLAGKLASRIDEAQKDGKDVSALLAQLKDMQAKTQDAQAQATAATAEVIGLDPSGYPGNRGALETGRSDVKAGRDDVFASIKDAESIISGLKALNTGTATTPTTTG